MIFGSNPFAAVEYSGIISQDLLFDKKFTVDGIIKDIARDYDRYYEESIVNLSQSELEDLLNRMYIIGYKFIKIIIGTEGKAALFVKATIKKRKI